MVCNIYLCFSLRSLEESMIKNVNFYEPLFRMKIDYYSFELFLKRYSEITMCSRALSSGGADDKFAHMSSL